MATPGTVPHEAAGPNGPKRIVRALRHRNYRLFFIGQGISLIGTWLTQVATAWLVYRLTGSELLLGVVSFAGQGLAFLLTPLAGVLVDRWDRHRILLVTQTLSMLQSFALALLALTGRITVHHVILLNVLQGIVNAVDMPARQSFVVQMVDRREDLPNAIALNSSMFNGARLIGPAVAGLLIAAVGEGICFLVDGFSYLAVIASLLAMRIEPPAAAPRHGPVLRGVAEGFAYAFGFAPIRSILLLLALVSLVGMPYSVLMPVFAKDVLHGGPETLGFLMGATGIGALAGSLYLASRSSVRGLGRVIVAAASLFGAGLVAFALSRVLWLSLLVLLVVGFGAILQMASCNTLLQTIVDEDKRGRVMSLYAMALLGVAPFGSLLAGALAGAIGAPATVALSGGLCLAGGALFARKLPALRELVRPIYARKGIVLEATPGAGPAGR